ncbi:MAG: GIY-YIG nuclease family protein [Saprospiraceae bacterium]|nr:GIY-YIG nuclease family protein [Saprospiraceae bacterium]
MKDPRFAIIDIETTGGIAKRDKITEIAIIIYQNDEIIDTFESLINPERSIPYEITRITGITNAMVETAPKFYEVAKDIIKITEDCIFVAHNVFFDYNFIKEEFQQLGFTYSRKKLCTVQLSRRYFRGLKSYSLGSLIEHFKIAVNSRHRAMEDTKATLDVFKRVLKVSGNLEQSQTQLTVLLKETKIPATLNKEELYNLPESPGIYYMRNANGDPIYIGKSKNIRDRVFQHLNETTSKTKRMIDGIHSIDFLISGNELMASLLEVQEIKKFQPEINRALRKKSHAALLTIQFCEDKYTTFTVKEAEWLDSNDEIINHYASRTIAKEHLEYIISMYQLCKKANEDLLDGKPCNSFQMGQCLGACVQKEDLESYNNRVLRAYQEINKIFQNDFLIIGEGRSMDEQSIAVVEDGFCKYFGFVSKELSYNQPNDLINELTAYKGNIETNRLIESYLNKSKSYRKITYRQNTFLDI